MISSESHVTKGSLAQGSWRKFCLGLVLHWKIDLLFVIFQELAYWPVFWDSSETESGSSKWGRLCGRGAGVFCARVWYRVPIALHQISLARPLSTLSLPVNLSGIRSPQCHLFAIVLPSDHLPFVNSPPLGTPTASWSPPIVQPGKTESEERPGRRGGQGNIPACWHWRWRYI